MFVLYAWIGSGKEDVNAGMVCRMYTGIVRQDGCGG
jgi:hypothetical protein